MITLKSINVSLEQICIWGATASYSKEVVERMWGNQPQLTIEQLLDHPVHPHFICWILLRKEILPSRILHFVAQEWVEDFFLKQKDKGVYIDFRLENLLLAKRQWLDGKISIGALMQASSSAKEVMKLMSSKNDNDAILLADIVYGLLTISATESINNAYSKIISFGNIRRDIITKKWSEEWNHRLAEVSKLFKDLVSQNSCFSELFINFHKSVTPKAVPAGNNITDYLPIGTILPFSGDLVVNQGLEAALNDQGWLYCNGNSVCETEFSELFTLINTAWGKIKESEFCLPDLRGCFLRGVSGSSSADPDKGIRKSVKSSGNEGNKAGTIQQYGTHFKSGTVVTIPNGSIAKRSYDSGCDERDNAAWGQVSHNIPITGGDAETRPDNKGVYYFIKCKNTRVIPAGFIMAYVNTSIALSSAYSIWKVCDGASLSPYCAFDALFKNLGFAHGGDENGNFLLPDFNKYFLRGVSDGEGNDPNISERTSTCTYVPGNRYGVGSVQKQATAIPISTAFFKVSTPERKIDDVICLDVKKIYNFNAHYVSKILNFGNMDEKTIPINYSVNWIIALDDLSSGGDGTDIPIGAVISTAEKLINPSVWLLCDGTEYKKETYEELYDVIGDTYDLSTHNEDSFNVPDYRGYFLMGAADDTLGVKKCQSTVAKPNNPFFCSIPNLPTRYYDISGITRDDGSACQGEITLYIKGCDSETRPLNMSVYYYIKSE